MKTEELFERAPVWKSIFKMCLPTVVVMLVMTVYNMADMVFVGQTGIAAQVAAVSLASPFFLLQMTLGTWIGGGGCTVISTALGAKDTEKPNPRRRMYAFKPCFRRPARRRRAPFPERLPALFRRRCRHVGLHRAVPSDSGARHARGGLFQCIRKPCPRRRCRAGCRHAQYARHCHQYYT